jgi:Zn finger protein HypA/HybF involved in hydrogenase expression
MEELKLDGNAAAGLLQEIFAVEVTTATGTCDACGAIEQVGALVVYKYAPGVVIRCPHCDSVLMRIVSDGSRYWVDLRGVRTLQLHA